RSLKSGKTLMDTVMPDTMHMEQNPKIDFMLTELVLRDPPKAGEPLRLNAKGDLTVAGVKKAIAMPVTMEQIAEGKLKVMGSVPLKMTDFGMKPPAPKIAAGMIKTGDDVKIGFTWVIAVPAK
ncbi:MAG: YceI family protein, partial [Pedosphaera parvula]|nr:YceI family protein [Pedosphaera parvula]